MQEKVAVKTKPSRRARRDKPAKLDPVDYAVISQGLIAAAREMGTKLVRSSYSNIVREAQDASAALFDRDGNVIAQAEHVWRDHKNARRFLTTPHPELDDRPPIEVAGLTAETIAAQRVSPEGQAGMRSFLEKRRAPWLPDGD